MHFSRRTAAPVVALHPAFAALDGWRGLLIAGSCQAVLELVGAGQDSALVLAAFAVGARLLAAGRDPWAGMVLSLARSLGEFGAVKIVSGNFTGVTQTATLVVEQKYQNFEQSAAYATSFILATASVLCIVVVSLLRPKEQSQ